MNILNVPANTTGTTGEMQCSTSCYSLAIILPEKINYHFTRFGKKLPMNKLVFSSFICIVVFSVCLLSCSGSSETDKDIIKIIEENIATSSSLTNFSTQNILHDINEKRNDPITSYKANIWYHKAEQVVRLTTNCYNYIENLKRKAPLSNELSASLLLQIKNYEK